MADIEAFTLAYKKRLDDAESIPDVALEVLLSFFPTDPFIPVTNLTFNSFWVGTWETCPLIRAKPNTNISGACGLSLRSTCKVGHSYARLNPIGSLG